MAGPTDTTALDPERDFERLREASKRRFLARARRAGQQAFHDLDQAADDAYQDAWLEVVQRPDAAAIEVDPAGYLAGVMWHRFHRRELRGARPRLVELGEADVADFDTPEDAVLRAEATTAAREALLSLPERERRALVLRAIGLRHRDVAASLGVSPLRARKLADAARRGLAAAGDACASTDSSLRAIAAGWNLSGRRRARLEAHLATCPSCRATLAELRREGALALGPVILAHPGWTETLAGIVGRGGESAVRGGEIAGGGAAGAALAAKLAAGCAAVCLVGGGVAVVVERTAPERPAPLLVAATPTAPPRAVRRAAPTADRPASTAAVQQTKLAADAARDAQATARRAARRATRAARRATVRARAAQAKAETGRQAAERAGTLAREGAATGARAAERARDAVSGALGRLGG